MPSSINLPCRTSPTSCTYHKLWSSPLEPQSKNSLTVSTSTPKRKDQKSPQNPQKSHLQTLPTELLDQITSYLSKAETACLALTSRSLAHSLGSETWRAMSKAGTASWAQHLEMLDILERDYDPEEWWRCPQCLSFHLRHRHVSRMSRLKLNIWLGMGFGKRKKVLSYGTPNFPIYVIDFEMVRGIMDRHFKGAGNGICLQSLQCSGTRTFKLDDIANILLTYSFTPRIVLDRLLLHSTYTFEPLPIRFINSSFSGTHIVNFLCGLEFWFCGHLNMGVAREVANLRGVRGVRYFKCGFCSTEYGMYIDVQRSDDEERSARCEGPHVVVTLKVWQNLGVGRTPTDPRWKHLATGDGKGKGLVWGCDAEDIREAYQRIYCSTRAEFDRQMQMARNKDGRVYSEDLRKYIRAEERWATEIQPVPWIVSPAKSLPERLAVHL